jgi:hypothetical protein
MIANVVLGCRRIGIWRTVGSWSVVQAAVAGALLTACTSSQAALLSSEPFADAAYSDGTELPTLNPSIGGYTGAWTDVDFGDAEAAVVAGSLDYVDPLYAAETGSRIGKGADAEGINATNSGRVFRLLDGLVATGTTDRTLYLSWLFQTGNENAAGNADTYQTLALYNTNTGDGNRTFDAGISSADFATPDYGFRVNNNAATRSGLGVAPDTGVHLFVAKFVLSATDLSDSATVWFDPTLGGVGDPAGGVTFSGLNLLFDRLAISDYASNSSYYDEIRWGDTFGDVTSVPEPCGVVLLLSGLWLMQIGFRRVR